MLVTLNAWRRWVWSKTGRRKTKELTLKLASCSPGTPIKETSLVVCFARLALP
jgi:hypothetical protein